LSAAADLFLAEGYGSTSIEAVAARAGVSKRTFYDRFDDKAMLFAAVVHRIIEQARPPPEVPLVVGETLPEMLRHVARLILLAALTPQALALHRLIHAEAVRFPELVRAVASGGGTSDAIALISDLLARKLPNSNLSGEDRAFAAQELIYMVVSLPQRRALGFGTPMTPDELASWADKVVRLFLHGCAGLNT
jgi:TetR/AcrR family transcriptional regulator, mexJK operon transcriptional repressor